MKSYTLYKHTSPSGKVYIGITSRKPEYRWNHGRGYSEKDQPLFHRAIKKYGWSNITHEILYSNLSETDAKNLEISLIKQYKALKLSYNITDGGDGFRGATYLRGRKHSEETKKRMREVRAGTNRGPKNPMYGRHETAPAYGKFGKQHPASKKVYQYDKLGNFIKEWDCLSDAQRSLNILVTHITACCNGRQKTAGGYIWRRQFDEKLRLDKEKLDFEKTKHKEDNALKDKISLRQQRNRTSNNTSK